MIRRPPRSTPLYSSAASDVYKRQGYYTLGAYRKNINNNEITQYEMLFEQYFLKSFSSRLAEYSNPEIEAVSYTHLRAHETKANLVCRLLLEKKKKTKKKKKNKKNKKKKNKKQ